MLGEDGAPAVPPGSRFGTAQCHRSQVSRSRAMPVGDRRSGRPRARSAASMRDQSAGGGAGFALPRDAGRRPALQAVPAIVPRLRQRQEAVQVSRARCRSETGAIPALLRGGDRARSPSPRLVPRASQRQEVVQVSRSRRCRSETGAPAVPAFVRPRGGAADSDRSGAGRPALRPSLTLAKAGSGAGFALPRDAGRRPALQPSPRFFAADMVISLRVAQRSRSRAMPVGDRRSARPGADRSAASAKAGSGAGFALPRDAGRRPALRPSRRIVPRLRQRQEVVQVSRSRAMPVGDRRSRPSRRSFRGFGKGRKWRRFRAPARCRSETGAPSRPRARSAASAKAGSGAGFALPRDAGRRPALRPSRRIVPRLRQRQEVAQVSRSRAMPVGDRRSKPSRRIVPRLRQRQEVVQVSRSRAMPVGDRRSSRPALSFCGFGKGRKWRRFRAPARCRSETGAPVPALLRG